VYIYTRWLDMNMLGPSLQQHVLFSSGWEWGYWQNDYLTLRGTFEASDSWQAPVEAMLAPLGQKGAALAAQIEQLATVQHHALIEQRLASYMAGTDFLIEGAYPQIISQPHRPSVAEIAALSPADRAAYEANVLAPLDQLASDTDAVAKAVTALGGTDDPWIAEIRDGAAVDAARVKFIAALYRALTTQLDGGTPDAQLAAADAALADAKTIVARRHAHLHDPDPKRILESDSNNATIYKYGYLSEADTLCYWNRERIQARTQILGETDTPPGCVIGF
jgi:hypothetical protein